MLAGNAARVETVAADSGKPLSLILYEKSMSESAARLPQV